MAGAAHSACVCPSDLTHVLLTRLILSCVSSESGFSLQGSVDREGCNIRACFVFSFVGLVGGLWSSSSAWASGLHPVPEVLLLGELPPWLGSQGLICSSEEPVASGVLTMQMLNEVGSGLQLLDCV